ncbi:MAG: FAD-dependent oxidoreductase [Verrucomicrobia bacterium]|jgi:flavin-dependent dehydrogenase|nr:FAD-dependent oxidoreductase [Verrucomicrobiota bacterium]
MQNDYDVVIIGAGPSGCSAASILAEEGHRVLILEREKFPRYRIGESMIPFTYFPLKRLGLIDRMRQSHFVKKHSVQFVAPSGKTSQPFYFSTRYDKDVSQTWQVVRSEFDQMMLDHALEKGAEVIQEVDVKDLIRGEDQSVVGVCFQDKEGKVSEVRARITLDGSGKEAFSVAKNKWRERDPYLNKVAVWTYYKNAKRDEGIDAGATTVAFVPKKGWFWFIPQHDNMTSVGVVAEAKYLTRDGVKKPEDIFKREIEQNKWIHQYLSDGEPVGPYRATSEYTFRSKYSAEKGLLLIGDAFGFLDPVFSSGLLIALKSGVLAGETISQCLKDNDLSPSRFIEYSRVMCEGMENMRKLVYAFYNDKFSFKDLIDKYPELGGDVTDCLSGDVNKDFSGLWEKIRDFADIPEELPFGMPLTEATSESTPA